MKFARYLEDTQTPEWKKAYIDYRGLKKRIASINRQQTGLEAVQTTEVEDKPAKVRWSTDDRSHKAFNPRRLSVAFSICSRNSNLQPVPLYAILLTLPPLHIEFFTFLDQQLEKIDHFYLEREKEAQTRSKVLEIQLRELDYHRKIFLVIGLLSSAILRSVLIFLLPNRAFIQTMTSLGHKL